MELLNAFRNKLFKAKNVESNEHEENEEETDRNPKEIIEPSNETDPLKAIFNHRLELDEEIKVNKL